MNYSDLIKQAHGQPSFENQEPLPSLDDGPVRASEPGLAASPAVPITILTNELFTDTMNNLSTELSEMGYAVEHSLIDHFSPESLNSSNGIHTVVRGEGSTAGHAGAARPNTGMITVRIVRPEDIVDVKQGKEEIHYVADDATGEIVEHLSEEGLKASNTLEGVIALIKGH